MASNQTPGAASPRKVPAWLRLILLLVLLYGFLVAVGLMSSAFKILGSGSAGGLFEGVVSPFAALAVGILGTVLVQSSSVTTATIVAVVTEEDCTSTVPRMPTASAAKGLTTPSKSPPAEPEPRILNAEDIRPTATRKP